MNQGKLVVVGIDPGKAIGVCLFSGEAVRPRTAGTRWELRHSLELLAGWKRENPGKTVVVAIESVVPYASPMSADVIETCFQIGWIQRSCEILGLDCLLISRKEVKSHLLGKTTGADADVKRALVDVLGDPGTKKSPGKTYGVSGHSWAALAVAYAVHCQLSGDKGNSKKFCASIEARRAGAQ